MMQTQQATRAPFFKPLSPPSVVQASQSSESLQERGVDKQRTAAQATRNKDLSWDTIQSASLHARLQQEAEKIRRWKLSTELDIKQRERKIIECQTTIEQQRKALLDMQLEAEDITVHLQNEVSNQQELHHKIEATRDMCRALKDHSAKVHENIQNGEEDRAELHSQQQSHLGRIQELVSSFKQLEIRCFSEKEEMEKQFQLEQVNCTAVKHDCETKVSSLLHERVALQSSETSLHQKCLLLSNQLEDAVKARIALEEERVVMGDKLKHSESVAESQAITISSLGDRLQACQDTIAELTNRAHSLQEAMANLETHKNQQVDECRAATERLSDEVTGMKNALQSVQTDLSSEETRSAVLRDDFEALQRKYDCLLEEKGSLDASNNALSQSLAQMTKKNEFAQGEVESLRTKLMGVEEELASAKTCLVQSKEKVSETEGTLSTAQQTITELTTQIEELEESKTSLGKDIEVQKEALASMQRDSEGARQAQETLNDDLCSMQKELTSSRSECEVLQSEVNSLSEECKAVKEDGTALGSVLDEAKAQLQSSIEAQLKLRRELTELEEHNTTIRDELNQAQTSASCANGKAGEALEKKQQQIKTLKKDLAEEVKKVRTCEKQIRTLDNQKGDLEKKVHASEAKVEELTEEVDKKNEEINSNVNKMLQLETLREKAEDAIVSERAVQVQYEMKSQELCATLEKYKMENQKIVEAKDKEVEELREKIQAMEGDLQSTRDTRKQLEGEVLDLQHQVEEQKQQIAGSPTAASRGNVQEEQAMEVIPTSELMSFNKLPRTPRAPASLKSKSPGCRTPLTPTNITNTSTSTPGILRTGPSSLPCKRKVMFAGDAATGDSPEASEDSSAQESLIFQAAGRVPTTPRMQGTQSSQSSSIPATPRSNVRRAPSTPTSARRAPAAKQPRTVASRPDVQEAMDQFSELFPNEPISSHGIMSDKDKAVATARDKKRTSSLQSKRGMKKLKIKTADGSTKKVQAAETNWFDTDTVFGFHPEA